MDFSLATWGKKNKTTTTGQGRAATTTPQVDFEGRRSVSSSSGKPYKKNAQGRPSVIVTEKN